MPSFMCGTFPNLIACRYVTIASELQLRTELIFDGNSLGIIWKPIEHIPFSWRITESTVI